MFKPRPAPSSGTSSAGTMGDSGVGSRLSPSDAYAAVVDPAIAELVEIRAKMGALQAREAALLTLCDNAAAELAKAEKHPDHGEFAHRSLAAEIGFAVRESDRAMVHKIGRATTLVERYPAVHSALSKGKISQAHANVICDAGEVIGVGIDEATLAKRAAYERQVLEVAQEETSGRLRPIARGQAEAQASRTLDERHRDAVKARRVVLVEQSDGMTDIVATVPAIYGKGIMDRLDQIAWAVKNANRNAECDASGVSGSGVVGNERGLGERTLGERTLAEQTLDERSLDEIRTDAFVEMLLGSDPSKMLTSRGKGLASIQARVQVIVPEERLSAEGKLPPEGSSDRKDATNPVPAELVGYGPVDTQTVRKVAGLAPSWERVIVSMMTGDVLSVDTYRPSAAIKRFLAARDLRCRAPGCNVTVNRSDIDHTIDAALGGATSTDNLANLCRYHHTMKHHPGWKLTQKPGGVVEWVTPLGRKYTDRPGSRVRFRKPEGSRSEGSRPESSRSEGSRPEGSRPQVSRPQFLRPRAT
ncbi:DUF222 domain-containing protein [Leucobacter viscericola]|uniref:DUF222 domain-containing protein n=1 Tax=Leucobacter viscericola TaxID=2714935 RepID=A0A6G7XB80_9MICO|nr:HNH endonuclease signature motif containing protein [Leucobacter viscericola]QIK61815.1 DUF222 domain-containing protein [Leucobacter viscericola]